MAPSSSSSIQPTAKPTHSESSIVVVTNGEIVSKPDAHKLSTWRKIRTQLRRRRASRQIADDKSRLESSEPKKKSFIRAFLDAACPPLPTPAPPGPETFVRIPFAYRQKDHPGVLVSGRRVPFSIHMHLGRKSDQMSALEAIAEES